MVCALEGIRPGGAQEHLAHPEVVDFDPSAARDPNDAGTKCPVWSLLVGVTEGAAEVCDDVVDASQRDRITVALLNEIREASPVDPFTRDEVLALGCPANTKDPCDVAMRKGRRCPAGLSKIGRRLRRNQLRPDDTDENRALGLLVFRGPHDCLRVLIDLIDDLESSTNHRPRV